jgi:hypothetical protein
MAAGDLLRVVAAHLRRKDKNAPKVGTRQLAVGLQVRALPPFRQQKVERMGHGSGRQTRPLGAGFGLGRLAGLAAPGGG